MSKKILYATSNPGKLEEVGRYLRLQGLTMVSPSEVGGELDVPETGQTLEENALLKAQAYLERYPEYRILADDTGVEILGLNGEPGIHVRRWKDHIHPMTDEEIIAYCIERMRDLKDGERVAQFRTVIVLAEQGHKPQVVDGTLPGRIVEVPIPHIIPGFPFESLFFSTEYQMMLGEMHQLPDHEKRSVLTHRERAVEKILTVLRTASV